MSRKLTICPISKATALEFIGEHHRHNRPPKIAVFVTGLRDKDGDLVGVGVAANPIARHLDDGKSMEIIRCCTNGHKNACSMIYGALCRAGKALGYEKAYTYTLQSEPGSSLKASGFSLDEPLPARKGWDTPSRRRPDVVERDLFGVRTRYDTGPKIRWVRYLR